MYSIQQLLLLWSLAFSQIQMTHGQSHNNHHRYTETTSTTNTEDETTNAAKDDELTNEDTILDVGIIPPLRLNIFETNKALSDSGKKAIIKAMNEHATYRLQIYFRNTIYFFDKVEFELLESHTLERVVNNRKLRSFEREELDTREDAYTSGNGNGDDEKTSLRRNKDVNFIQSSHAQDGERNLQQQRTMYGTSLLLGGKIKFSLFPSASSAECNKQLFLEMKRDWFMHKYINEQNHTELQNVKQWLINTSKETLAPTPSPSSYPVGLPSFEPSSEPSEVASKMPSIPPKPSLQPSSKPSLQPSIPPSIHPSDIPSLGPSTAPTSSPKPTQVYQPSSKPSEIPITNSEGNGLIETSPELTRSILPILIATGLVTLFVFVLSGMFFMKKRKHESELLGPNGKELGHKRLKDNDNDSDIEPFDNEDQFSTAQIIPSLLSTKDESASMESDDSSSGDDGDYFSESSAIASSKEAGISVSSSATMKINNISEKENSADIEKKWMAQSPAKDKNQVSSRPPKAPSSASRSFPIKLDTEERLDDFQKKNAGNTDDEVSPNNISLEVVGAANGILSAGKSVGPSLMKFFVKSDRGEGSSTRSRTHSRSSSIASSSGQKSSPITSVTPSKVSKEEFEKGWGVNIPFSWNQNENSGSQPKVNGVVDNDIENAFNAFNDVDGSFPTFDADEQIVQKGTASMRSVGDSTAYQSANEMHPLDWSNKGSEYDGTSIGESTFTDGENTATREMNHVSWEQVNINASGGRTPLGINSKEMNTTQYMTPMTNQFQTPKSAMTDPSRFSGYTSGSGCESSPGSSRGSSKQLINDLVWLEKKIADVRKRVDKLDGDESICSPLKTPSSTDIDRSATGSPISHNIVCRDVIAPPGKLNIVIHSTKDGPAIHGVKPGSVLEGQLFKGDLVVAIDDTDTRSFNAVDVMEMMAQKSDCERKITIIHFDNFEA